MKKLLPLFLLISKFCLAQTHLAQTQTVGSTFFNQKCGNGLEVVDSTVLDGQIILNLQRGFGVGVLGIDNNGRGFWSAGGGGGGAMTKQQTLDTLASNVVDTIGNLKHPIYTSNGTAAAGINPDGSFFQSSQIGEPQKVLSYTIHKELNTFQLTYLSDTPIVVIPRLNGYTTKIKDAFVEWSGTVGFDGIQSLYFYTQNTSDNQFQIDVGSSVSGYSQRGIPVNILLGGKDNVKKSQDVYVKTNSVSTGFPNGQAEIYIEFTYTLVQ